MVLRVVFGVGSYNLGMEGLGVTKVCTQFGAVSSQITESGR